MPRQAAEIVWNWKLTRCASKSRQSVKRTRFWLQAGVMGAVGSLFFLATDHRILPCILWTLTVLILAGLLFSDRILHGFDRAGALLARAVGSGLTWGLLTPFFFIVFGVGRLMLILARKDPLNRKFDPQASSYWTNHPGSETTPRYQKQF